MPEGQGRHDEGGSLASASNELGIGSVVPGHPLARQVRAVPGADVSLLHAGHGCVHVAVDVPRVVEQGQQIRPGRLVYSTATPVKAAF